MKDLGGAAAKLPPLAGLEPGMSLLPKDRLSCTEVPVFLEAFRRGDLERKKAFRLLIHLLGDEHSDPVCLQAASEESLLNQLRDLVFAEQTAEIMEDV